MWWIDVKDRNESEEGRRMESTDSEDRKSGSGVEIVSGSLRCLVRD
jgi:hypothetical protein